jgi:hypothetical protein
VPREWGVVPGSGSAPAGRSTSLNIAAPRSRGTDLEALSGMRRRLPRVGRDGRHPGPAVPGQTRVTAPLDDVTRSKRPEPAAEEAAATELVELAREQGQPPHPPGRSYVVRLEGAL